MVSCPYADVFRLVERRQLRTTKSPAPRKDNPIVITGGTIHVVDGPDDRKRHRRF